MTSAKEKTMPSTRVILLVATATALAGCTEIVMDNEPPTAAVAIQFGGETYESGQGIESADGSDLQITLDGTGSSDADGSIAGYTWIRTDTTATARVEDGVDASAGNASTAMLTLPVGTHRVTLWVTDDGGAVSEPTTVTISITSAAACLAQFAHPEPACQECVCMANSEMDGEGGCRDQVTNCHGNPDDAFASSCAALVECATMTGCSGATCYTADTCMAELDATVDGYGGFPAGCTDFDAGEAPCPTATAIGECIDANCADVCP